MVKINRRSALKTIGGLTGAAAATKFLSGCGSSDSGEPGPKVIVALMMENRTYDHVLGARSLAGLGGDGLVSTMSNKDKNGQDIGIYPLKLTDDLCFDQDPEHGWDGSRVQFAAGANTGFITAHEARFGDMADKSPMSYLPRELQPVTNALADSHTSCDRWFASLMGPTWPNRMYWFSGQSDGRKSNELFPANHPKWPNLFDQLDAAGVDFAYYFSDLPSVSVIPNLDITDRLGRVDSDFLEDAAAGKLPPVVFIDPGFSYNDDHPPHHPLLGQQFISFVYSALAESPQWEDIMLVVTYDEHGGFFDHVPPPKTADDRAADGFDQLGFRVPTLVAGPWTKSGFVSSVQYDHTSVIAHLTAMYGLEPLNMRVQAANNLMDCIDMNRINDNNPAPPIELPAVEVDESMLDEKCTGLFNEKKGPVEEAADQGYIPKHLDRRGKVRDLGYFIGDYLDTRNLGRIRRGK